MLDAAARVANYQAQTDRDRLTPRQQRRIKHKRNRQSPEAQDRRDSVTRARIVASAARARRRAQLPAA